MSDDPRDILSEAGVEVPEVEAYERAANMPTWRARSVQVPTAKADAAILALARLVAEKEAENKRLKHCRWCGALIEKCPICGEDCRAEVKP